MFFRISFVSDISEEPCYFALIICFSLFHLFQIAGKNHPSKHSSWWRRLGEDVLKTSWRRLQCNIFCLIRCLENVLKTSCEVILKTSWRRLEDVFGRRIANTSWRRLEDVLEDEKLLRWRRLEDVLENKKCLLGYYDAIKFI